MLDLNELSLDELADELLDCSLVQQLFDITLAEDLGTAGDITTDSIVDAAASATAAVTPRSVGVIAGLAVAQRLLQHADRSVTLERHCVDGDFCEPGQMVAAMHGSLRDILLLERPVLNILGRLSGIATKTRDYVNAVAETGAVICDTRKTVPGNRMLEKYAVRCGGGSLHRIGLYDAALFKDNHLANITPDELAQRLAEAARRVRSAHDVRFVEVEVDSLVQLEEVLSIEPGLIDIVLLDNMSPQTMLRAAAMRREHGAHVQLEASGGVSLQAVPEIARSGVDRIAIGALTHSAPWLDIGLDVGP